MPGPKVRCRKCGDVIQSMHRHDFVRCNCGAIFVDGGDDYFRYGWTSGGTDPGEYIEYVDFNKEEECLKNS